MSYINIDYSVISAQLLNAIILGVVLFNTDHPNSQYNVSFDKAAPLSVSYSLVGPSDARAHTLTIAGPDSSEATLINESHGDIDETDREIMKCIGRAFNMTVVPAFFKMAEDTYRDTHFEISGTIQ